MAEEIDAAACPKHEAQDGPSLLQDGNLVFQAHHVGWIVASFFTIIAVVTSGWLIGKHLQWYTNKREQRYIVRILLLVPVYAIISLLSYFFWDHSTPLLLVRDAYESTVLTAFFYLLLSYLSPDETEQRAIFLRNGLSREADAKARLNGDKVKTWVFPMGFVKWKPSDGLYFLQWMKWGVLQYCVIRPLTTLAAVALEYAGLYCEDSWGPEWGHVYITVIVSLSVTIAMYCLIQLYVVVSDELAEQRPLLKLFAIKAVVFLTFWQASFLSVLSMLSVIKDTKYMTAEDINIGIGALLETFEMMLFAFLHIRAFTYKVYRPHHDHNSTKPHTKRTPMLRSFLHAMDFRETFQEIWQGWKYMWAKIRGREPPSDQNVKRLAYYEGAFGKSRTNLDGKSIHVTKHTSVETSEKECATLPDVHLDVAAEERAERQWLGLGDEFVYGLHREKSDNLEVQIERELERRGYGSHIPGRGHIKVAPGSQDQPLYDHRPQRSWWRNIYNRISQSGQDTDEGDRYSPVRQPSHRRRHSKKHRAHRPSKEGDGPRRLLGDYNQRYEFDDPPPPSLIRQSRGQPQRPSNYHQDENGIIVRDDLLSPLSVYTDHRSSHVHRQQQRNLASPPPPSSRHVSKQHRSSPRRDPENRLRSPSPRHDASPSVSHQLSPSMVHMVRSADSLFGRVFPPSTEHGTSLGHGQNTPSHESHGHNIGLAGERSTRHAHVDAASTAGITVEIFDEARAPHMSGTQSHERDSAFHKPELPVDTGSATSDVAGPPQMEGDAYATPPSDRQSPPRRSNGLRRNSAQVYSPADIARRRQSRQQSMPTPQRMPQPSPHTFYAQPDRYPDLRVTSPTPTQYSSSQDDHHRPRFPAPAASYSNDNTDSCISQPSFSGTPRVNKHANDPYMSSEALSRYPGLPAPRSPRTSDRRPSGQPSRTYQPPGQFSPSPNDRRQWP